MFGNLWGVRMGLIGIFFVGIIFGALSVLLLNSAWTRFHRWMRWLWKIFTTLEMSNHQTEYKRCSKELRELTK